METTNNIEMIASAAEAEIVDVAQMADEAAAVVAETTAVVETTRDYWTPENLAKTAPIMGKGMLGIFIVMGIIILCVGGLNNVSSSKKNKNQQAK